MLGHCHPGSKHYGSLYAGLCLGCSRLLVGLGQLSFRNLRDKRQTCLSSPSQRIS